MPTHPDHGVALTRLRFDAWLRDAAIAAGAEPVTGRVAAVRAGSIELDDHLRRLGLLSTAVEGRRLGGWLKMGMVGTVAARGRTFLVGDAAGLVNPLQGEGIAPAMTSAAAAAEAILAGPGSAAARYRHHLAAGPARYASVAAPVHATAIAGSPRRVALLGRALTLPGVGAAIAAPWALTWNDLLDGAPPGPATLASRLTLAVGRAATVRSRVRRRLTHDLDDDSANDWPSST